jgi:signal recognition particle GTPase
VVIGGDMEKLIQQANQAFERYLQQMGNQDFEDAGNALNDLKESLRQLEEGGE